MKKLLSLAILAAILALSLVSCAPSTPTPPAFTLDGAPLPAYEPLIYSGPADGEGFLYTPEEMIALHKNDIPMTITEKSALHLEKGNSTTTRFHGVYLINGKKTAYTENDLASLPVGCYILAAEATFEDKNPKNSRAHYIFTGIDIRSDAETPTYLQKPTDTDLEFWIIEDVLQVDFSAHTERTGLHGARQFFGMGYTEQDIEAVLYTITAYPDLADGGKFVTNIYITDPKLKLVCGLTAASSMEEWDEALTRMGLVKLESPDILDKSTLAKESWESPDGKLSYTVAKRYIGTVDVQIHAAVTNRTGIAYY